MIKLKKKKHAHMWFIAERKLSDLNLLYKNVRICSSKLLFALFSLLWVLLLSGVGDGSSITFQTFI